jgi:hypothetical protein
MAVTGTSTFTVTRDDIIKAALRALGALGVGETPITEDYLNCSQALNIMIKSWAKKGLPLWVNQQITIPMVSGVSAYKLGPTATGSGSIVMPKPIRFVEAFLRDSNNIDVPLTQVSQQEYNTQGNKAAAGNPNQFYYDSQEADGILYVLNVPDNSTDVIKAQVQRQFYDMTSSGDNFDFPQAWFQALKWGLAAELCTEYPVDVQMISYYEQKAAGTLQECFDESVEETSVYFTMRYN